MDFLTFSASSPLLFTQIQFWLFLFVVLCVFAALRKRLKMAHIWLLLVSIFFYYKSSGNFVILLIIITILTYLFALAIKKSEKKLVRRTFLIIGIVFDLLFLLYFKYTYFVIDLLNQYCSTSIKPCNYLNLFCNNTFGTHFSFDKIILPVGISFYSFQAISFLVDIYKDKLKQRVSFIDFAFYLSFFPQLVAGPIVRADVFLPQIDKPWYVSRKEFSIAIFLIINGLLKKMLVSDYISINFVDRIFSSPTTYSSMENLLAMYGYTMQIYCDFSGYTDIAIAVSLLFGFHLPKNFDSPYKSLTITEFWRRWHISLSSWLRDYIYIPLGGNRKGKIRQYLNLMATMFVGGLWHGANLKFIFWGVAHGFLLIIDKILKPLTDKALRYKIGRFLFWIITFHLVNCLWIFFRADSFSLAIDMIEKISNISFLTFFTVFQAYWKPLTIIILAFVIHILPKRFKDFYKNTFYSTPLWLKVIIIVLVVFILVQVKSSEIQPFIYFQF